MAKRKKPPELAFQEHVADFLVLDHIIFNRTGYFSFLEDGRL
jgi:DNA repair protein RadC